MVMTNTPEYVSLIGIDPGSTHLGISVMRVDPINWKIINTRAKTIHAQKLIDLNSDLVIYHGEKIARIRLICQKLYTLFQYERPLAVASESPFYSQRRPSAFGVLTEVIDGVRDAVYQYNSLLPLTLIDPPTVKKAVGAPGNADKLVVKNFVKMSPIINYAGDTPIDLLDEHSIDSIAVNFAQFTLMEKQLCLRN